MTESEQPGVPLEELYKQLTGEGQLRNRISDAIDSAIERDLPVRVVACIIGSTLAERIQEHNK